MAERVKRIIELMQDDPSRTFTLDQMAESVNLSPAYFCCLFKSITGTPPAKYLKSLRMQQAATLLTTTFQRHRGRQTRWLHGRQSFRERFQTHLRGHTERVQVNQSSRLSRPIHKARHAKRD